MLRGYLCINFGGSRLGQDLPAEAASAAAEGPYKARGSGGLELGAAAGLAAEGAAHGCPSRAASGLPAGSTAGRKPGGAWRCSTRGAPCHDHTAGARFHSVLMCQWHSAAPCSAESCLSGASAAAAE